MFTTSAADITKQKGLSITADHRLQLLFNYLKSLSFSVSNKHFNDSASKPIITLAC